MERETVDYDVVIVGAGPAGLAAACRLKQLSPEASVCVLEKGASVGAHSLSGAVFDPRALAELFPDWRQRGAPLHTRVSEDRCLYLTGPQRALTLPAFCIPHTMKNDGNYLISLGELCQWLAGQAEALGVEIYPATAATAIVFTADNRVNGVITGDFGRDQRGQPKPGVFTPGMALRARFTLFAEGCRGHLGKQLLQHFGLDRHADPQHYAIGLKELWQVQPQHHHPGLVVHATGWPLDKDNPGGAFLYHLDRQRVAVGLIVDLCYRNPYLSPFDELQRLKCHPAFRPCFSGATRLGFGARALSKGGLFSLPEMFFPGGALIGCELGTLNFSRIKGNHTAMKSGMLAAEAVAGVLCSDSASLAAYPQRFRNSWLWQELWQSRNFGGALHRYGPWFGSLFNTLEQNVFRARWPLALHDRQPDHQRLHKAGTQRPISYPKPDGQLTFDRLSSLDLANVSHAEDQPVHLRLDDVTIATGSNLTDYAEPAQRYCPAAVYELLSDEQGQQRLQINAQNCLHCKTCDIKDPAQNIHWQPPEGGGGPNYGDM